MRDIKQCHPHLQELTASLVGECGKQGIKIAIGECMRTAAEQDALYAQGRTKPGSIVTNAKGSTYSSMHQWGVAFDFYRSDGKGAYNESGDFFGKVGQIGKSIGLEWGGDWQSIKDKPHFQLPDWGSTTTKLKSLYKSPDAFKQSWKGENTKPTRPSKTVTAKSYKGDVLWLQGKANIVISRTGLRDSKCNKLSRLTEDGIYGDKSREFVRAFWRLLGWENSDTVGNAGAKTIAALELWR